MDMGALELGYFTPWDAVAVATHLGLWAGVSWRATRPARSKEAVPATGELINHYRRVWLREAAKREVRIMDAQLLGGLRQGSAFFASATLAALGGGIALLGQTETLVSVAVEFDDAVAPRAVWIGKILFIIAILASAFLHFIWAHRVFGYVAVMLGAMPDHREEKRAEEIGEQAGALMVSAGRAFNRGLRATYFAIAALSWLIGPAPLMIASILTGATIWRREFHSASRAALMRNR